MMTLNRNERGFTLTELLVAMALAGIVMAAIYSTYMSQKKSQEITEDVSFLQQNLRAAMYLMGREIRMAGFDPDDAGSFGFENISDTQITISWDGADGSDPNGVEAIPNEHIRYQVVSNQLMRQLGANAPQPVADSISGVSFQFLTISGVSTLNPGSIGTVIVTLAGTQNGHTRQIDSTIYCRNAGL